MLNKKDDKQFKDIQTDKRIHEHLGNEKDIISEEDIRNIKTDVAGEENVQSENTAETGYSSEDKELERQGKKTGRSDDPGIETSWNLLND